MFGALRTRNAGRITALFLSGVFPCLAQQQLVVLTPPALPQPYTGVTTDTFTIGSESNGQFVTGVAIFVTSDSSWLKLNSDCTVDNPGASSISVSTTATITFCVDPTIISGGNGAYVGLIEATVPFGQSYSPVTLSVKVKRFPPGDFTLDPPTLALSSNLTSSKVTIFKSKDAGNQAENENAVTILSAQVGQAAPEGDWLQFTIKNNTVTADAPGEIDIQLNRSSLVSQAPATYVHTLVVVDAHQNVDAVTVTYTVESSPQPQIQSQGVGSAGAFGQLSSIASGSWIEIFGSNLAADTRSWGEADFKGFTAPTSLDGTKVTIGNQAAFIDYISPGQINAQVPGNIGTGSQPVIVTTPNGVSASFLVNVSSTAPGLFAPVSFNVAGKQYVAALFPDGTYALVPGAVSGVTSRRPRVGDTITLYGIGFGLVTPNSSPGQVTQQSNTLALPFHLFFDQTEASLSYAGLAPGAIGLYQFNLVVPSVTSSDAVPLTFTLGGSSGTQKLYIPVQ